MDIPLYRLLATLLLLGSIAPKSAEAYPEFHKYIQEFSGRPLNCAMCHAHPDGPEGSGPGQIGGLDETEQMALTRARAANEAGQIVENPLLNQFGDSLVKWLGRSRISELKLMPSALAEEIPQESDIDRDGIPDYQEYQDGTHPLKLSDGAPWKLFVHNLRGSALDIVMVIIATLLGVWGITHMIRGFVAGDRSEPVPNVSRRRRLVAPPRRRGSSAPHDRIDSTGPSTEREEIDPPKRNG